MRRKTKFIRLKAIWKWGGFGLLMGILACSGFAQMAITYPAAGNLRTEEGTIELWMRLEAEPDASRQDEGRHYFPFFSVYEKDENGQPKAAKATLAYGAIWKPEWFHFSFMSIGKTMGQVSSNPYVVSVEDTQKFAKNLDKSSKLQTGAPYPRTPRLKKGEWHYLALTWTGDPLQVSLYLDGRQIIQPMTLVAGNPFEDLEGASFSLLVSPYRDNMTVDDLRISSVVRSEKEIQDAFVAGGLKADKYTLLLDRFENVVEGVETRPEVFSGDKNAPFGTLDMKGRMAEWVDGKTGKGIKILKY